MHFPVIFLVALAFLIANAQSSPVKRSPATSNIQPEDADTIHARTSDEDFSMSGNIERDFEIVSPPPKVIPRSGEEFSMSGVLPAPRRILRSRTGGITSTDDFNPVSPEPKTRPSHSRRSSILRSGFIGNLSARKSQKLARQAGGLTPYEQKGPSTCGTPEMQSLPQYYGGGSSIPWGNISTVNANVSS